jgi:hypothetical protein
VCNISEPTVELFAELGFKGMKWVKPLPNLNKEQTPTPKGKREQHDLPKGVKITS